MKTGKHLKVMAGLAAAVLVPVLLGVSGCGAAAPEGTTIATTATATMTATALPESSPETTDEPETVYEMTYPIVDTDQAACYDNHRVITCPDAGDAFYGQDAAFQGNQPSYWDNGDGTVSDLVTGLMWQQDPGDQVTYAEAMAGAVTCDTGGYDDWRLPTIKELYSLILFSGTDPSEMTGENAEPFLDTDYFVFEYGDVSAGDRIIDAQYWSATEYVSTTMGGAATVFGVNFADGRIKGYPKDRDQSGGTATHFVLYVRGNTDYGINSYADNGDGTITEEHR